MLRAHKPIYQGDSITSMSKKDLTTGRLARAAGVHVQTIRYYHRQGLLPEPERKASGYRQYAPEDVRRIQFIKRAQGLGFSLKEIKELLDLKAQPGTSNREVKERTLARIDTIDLRLRELQRMKTALERLVASCDGQGTIRECTILKALDESESPHTTPGK